MSNLCRAYPLPFAATPEPISLTLDDPYQSALEFLYDRIDYERMASAGAYRFRLRRMRELLQRLQLEHLIGPAAEHGSQSPPHHKPTLNDLKQPAGNIGQSTAASSPGKPCSRPKLPLVHIAGTKGKGSTATMIAAMLTAAGLKTGLYTSPHLHRLEERFCVDGQPCTADELVELVQRMQRVTVRMAQEPVGSPSFFELTTAMALLHFEHQCCDAIVVEVGLGGRLDSTNVCASTVSAITSIGLDHEHVLGNTVAAIAKEKAGILKPGVPAICGVPPGEARDVIDRRAAQVGAPLIALGDHFHVDAAPLPTWGTQIRYRGGPGDDDFIQADLGLEGMHQARNAAMAIAIVGEVRRQLGVTGRPLGLNASARALSSLRCAGRLERYELPRGVTAVIDAAHNEDSIAALCDCITRRAHGAPVTVVFGTSRDKSAESMLRHLAGIADRVVLTQFQNNPRFFPTAEMIHCVPAAMRSTTTIVHDPVKACRVAVGETPDKGFLVLCGSFFLVAEVRHQIAKWAGVPV